jgi:hypothetical protein
VLLVSYRPDSDILNTTSPCFLPVCRLLSGAACRAQRVIKPFELARQIAAASDLPSHGYGIVIMPRTLGPGPQQQQQQQHQQQGLLIAAVWSTSDSEQLDETEMQGDPIRYTHTCHQYISVDQQP